GGAGGRRAGRIASAASRGCSSRPPIPRRSPRAGARSSIVRRRGRVTTSSRSRCLRAVSASAPLLPRCRTSAGTSSPSWIAVACATARAAAASTSPGTPSPSRARGSGWCEVSTLDDVLDRLETLDDAGDADGLRAALRDALARFPGTPELREWEASIAADDERYAEALAILDGLVASHPHRPWARPEPPAVLLDLGRFADPPAALRVLPEDDAPVEQAGLHYDVGLCLDRLGQPVDADRAFRGGAPPAPHALCASP